MKSPFIKCRSCGGTGSRSLSGYSRTLFSTWIKLARKGPCIVTALGEHGKSTTTINARLCALEECGLAVRSGKEGRNDIWTAVTPGKDGSP
jgi:hypothetical protein